MNNAQILKQAKHYFGKDRSFIKEFILSMDFKKKDYRKWNKELAGFLPNPARTRYNLFDNIPDWIEKNQIEEIDWNWIGEPSWEIDIILNPNIHKGYDWDSKLASKCKNGTIRILTVYISEVLPCYMFTFHYEKFNKKKNYYETGPIFTLTKEEQNTVRKIDAHLKKKDLLLLERDFCKKRHKALYSDIHQGNASLLDVLFDGVEMTYHTEVRRWSDKDLLEKNKTKLLWNELYDQNGTLLERTESRYTLSGDLFRITLDANHRIKHVTVMREIEGEKFRKQFDLDILKDYKKQQQQIERKKKKSSAL